MNDWNIICTNFHDRDDPEAVDVNALYDEESPNEEDDLLGREVDLDDEYDL